MNLFNNLDFFFLRIKRDLKELRNKIGKISFRSNCNYKVINVNYLQMIFYLCIFTFIPISNNVEICKAFLVSSHSVKNLGVDNMTKFLYCDMINLISR